MNITEKIVDLLDQGETFCLATVIASKDKNIAIGTKTIIYQNGTMEYEKGGAVIKRLISIPVAEVFEERRKKTVEIKEGVQVFFDLLSQTVHLVICGAGHIAVPLARYAIDLGFTVSIIDDRPDFANELRFPHCNVIANDFIPALRAMPMGSSTYAVVITRGHEHDAECLSEILKKKTDYVGLIGSRRRVKFVLEMLSREGIHKKRLAEVFTPIGLPIGAESPEEIALSIISELVCVRRKGAEQAQTLRNSVGI